MPQPELRGRTLVEWAPVGDTHGQTLSLHADGKEGKTGPRSEPVLVLALECGRPRAGSRRMCVRRPRAPSFLSDAKVCVT